jgi:hypothetical protein
LTCTAPPANEGRRGQGTFIVSTLPSPPLANHETIQKALALWVKNARAAGLDEEAIAALFATTVPATLLGGRHECRRARGERARQARRLRLGAARLHPDDSVRLRLALVGPNGADKTTLLHPVDVLRCEWPTLLEFEWHFSGETRSVVRFELHAEEEHTRLVVEHLALGSQHAVGYAAGWHAHLDGLRDGSKEAAALGTNAPQPCCRLAATPRAPSPDAARLPGDARQPARCRVHRCYRVVLKDVVARLDTLDDRLLDERAKGCDVLRGIRIGRDEQERRDTCMPQ